MLTFVSLWSFLLTPHAATPPPAPVHAVAAVVPAPAPFPSETTTTTTIAPPVVTTTTVPVAPPEPAQPPATTDLTGMLPGQCAIAWNAEQTNPVDGQSSVITSTYRGDCGEAQAIAAQYPGAVVVAVPVVSDDPGCSVEGDCTSPTMGG